MNDDEKIEVYPDKKRRRLLPSKTPCKDVKMSSPPEPTPLPTPTEPTPLPARYDYDQWKKNQRVAEQSLPQTSKPPAHMPENDSTSNGINLVMAKKIDIQANKPSVIKTNPNVIERKGKEQSKEKRTGDHPPMTFEQQTQTDAKMQNFDPNTICKGLLFQQEIISEQVCVLAEDNRDLKKQVTRIQFDMRIMKTNMESIRSTLFKMCDYLQVPYGDEPVSFRTIEMPKLTKNPPRILNLTNPLNSTAQRLSYSSMSIEPMIDISNDSIPSVSSYPSPVTLQSIYQFETSNASDASFNASMKVRNESDSSFNTSIKVRNASDSLCNTSMKVQNASDSLLNTSIKVRNNSTQSNNKMKIEKIDKHPDDEGNPNDEVVIGPNQTTIPRSILLNINWASHTSATRRLLRAKFSREVLATHSLTGKPSPAFIESSKPTKHQLEPKIIGDIVSYVAKRCNVSETSVRSSITTKCADENKMMRQRMEKERRQSLKTEPNENKENSENKLMKNKGQESIQINKAETILKQNNKK